MEKDLNVLAAIGAARIGNRLPVVIPSNRHDDSNEVTNGMCKYTTELLDALASLSVAEMDKQVVAIALQMGSPTVLTIAENGPVKPKLLHHLQEMLALLQCMALAYAELGNWNGPPTEIPRTVQPYRNKLIKSVYLYSVDKILNRFKICWVRLQNSLQLFSGWGDATSLGKAGEWFRHVLCSLEFVEEILRKIKAARKSVVDHEWARLIDNMDRTIYYLTSGNHSVSEIIHDTPTATLCIKLLNKLSSQHHHIQNLTKIAHAARVDRNITFDIVVCESIVFSPVLVVLPQTVTTLQDIIQLIIPQENQPSDHRGADNTVIATRDIFDRFPLEPYGKVHCECALITHLDNLPSDGLRIPPCNYIGVSKLSCAPCDAWIRAFNASRGPGARVRTYHTMGTHSKWYRNWAKPPVSSYWLLADELGVILRTKLELGFSQRKHHGGSDSTIATGESDSAIAKGNNDSTIAKGDSDSSIPKGDSNTTSLSANPYALLARNDLDDGWESESSLNSLSYYDVR